MDKDLKNENSANFLIREIHQDCTVSQWIGNEKVNYAKCGDVYVYASGTVVVLGIASDRVLNSAAGPIEITRTGK